MLPEPKDRPVRLMDSASGRALSVRAVKARSLVDGPLGETSIEVTFANDLERAIEGDLVLSLPPSAALVELTVACGARTIRGKVRARERAKIEYRRAVDAGQTAALGETEGEDLVRMRIAPIDKGDDVRVTLGVLHALSPTADGHRLVIPLTYMPRFVEADAKLKETETAALDRPRPLTLAARADVTVEVRSGATAPRLRCASHGSSTEVGARSTTATISRVPLDRDVILDILDRADGKTSVWAKHDPGEGPDGLGPTTAIAVVPPAFADEGKTTPRIVTFLVDRSGSMGGAPMDSAIRAVRGSLRGLEAQDRFNIIAFDSSLEALSPTPVPFDDKALKSADAFISGIGARGGTDASMALRAALDQASSLRDALTVLPAVAPDARHRLHLIVFMTDGDVAGAEQVLTSTRDKLIDTRIHVLGIGDAVNHAMLGAIASAGSGTYTPVSTNEDLEQALATLKNAMSAPLWTGVKATLDVEGEVRAPKQLEPAGPLDLFAGHPMLLAWRGELPRGTRLVLTGQREDGDDLRIVTPLDAALSDTDEGSRRLASRTWALLRNRRLTYRFDPADEPTLEALGTSFGLANRAVALVGVHDEVRGVKAEESVPVVLPMPRNLASPSAPAGFHVGGYGGAPPPPMGSFTGARALAGGPPAPRMAMSAPLSPAGFGPPPPSPAARSYGGPPPGAPSRSSPSPAGFGGPPAYGAPPPPAQAYSPAMTRAGAMPTGKAISLSAEPVAPSNDLSSLTDDDSGLRALMLLQGVDGLFDGDVSVTLAAVAAAVLHGHTAREGAFRAELRRTVAWLRANIDRLSGDSKLMAALALSLLTVPHGEAPHTVLPSSLSPLLQGLSLSDRHELRRRVLGALQGIPLGGGSPTALRIKTVFLGS